MSLQMRLLTWWYGQLIGTDTEGNRYYEAQKWLRYGRPRRWVLYKKENEASQVPPIWHAWLHYRIDTLPETDTHYPWEKPHQPNLTGTSKAYRPWHKGEPHLPYQPWQPN